MKSKTYSAILVLIYAIIGAWLVSIKTTNPTYTGDLTRIGGFSENLYGPRSTYRYFTRNESKWGKTIQDYDSYYDVVVIGDSFSNARDLPSPAWQNFLAAKTGLRILSFHCDNMTLNELVHSNSFLKHPPKAIIFQSAEHGLHTKLIEFPPEYSIIHRPILGILEKRTVKSQTVEIERMPADGCDFNTAVHHATLQVKRAVGIRARSREQKLDNPPKRLFSSLSKDRMLVYYGDRWKLTPTSAEWTMVGARFVAAQNAVQKNGFTRFVLMIAPDRSSIYGEWYANHKELSPAVTEITDCFSVINKINTLDLLRSAVRGGVTDVYLPNDSHWSPVGFEIAAKAVEQHLYDTAIIQ
jgi:hypothetical protein